MPQIFNNAVVTDNGKALLSKEMSGECMIQITRMAVGSGIYTAAEKAADALQKMTGLKNERQSTGLSSLKRQDKTSVMVTGIFTNDNLDTAYNINEIGLFAQEKGSRNTEVLYSIAVVAEEEGEVMPASEGKNPVRIIQDWIVTVSNSADATIQSLPDGAFAMAADMGNIDELDTDAKGNLVEAVNESLRRLIVADTSGALGKKGAEVEAQDLLDELADKVMEKLLMKTGSSEDNTVTFESADNADAKSWTDVPVMKTGENHKSLFGKISTMFKNVRYLYRLLGTTDISKTGDGTVTGVIQDIISKKVNFADITQSAVVTAAGKKVMDAMEKNASVSGTLANEIGKINSNLADKLTNYGYYDGMVVSINDITEPGISRIYVQPNTDDHAYLGEYGHYLVITTGNCAGYIYQIFLKGSSTYMAYRHNNIQGVITLDYNERLHRVSNAAEITQLNNRITALERLINN